MMVVQLEILRPMHILALMPCTCSYGVEDSPEENVVNSARKPLERERTGC